MQDSKKAKSIIKGRTDNKENSGTVNRPGLKPTQQDENYNAGNSPQEKYRLSFLEIAFWFHGPAIFDVVPE